jgi:hypothetical protein
MNTPTTPEPIIPPPREPTAAELALIVATLATGKRAGRGRGITDADASDLADTGMMIWRVCKDVLEHRWNQRRFAALYKCVKEKRIADVALPRKWPVTAEEFERVVMSDLDTGERAAIIRRWLAYPRGVSKATETEYASWRALIFDTPGRFSEWASYFRWWRKRDIKRQRAAAGKTGAAAKAQKAADAAGAKGNHRPRKKTTDAPLTR